MADRGGKARIGVRETGRYIIRFKNKIIFFFIQKGFSSKSWSGSVTSTMTNLLRRAPREFLSRSSKREEGSQLEVTMRYLGLMGIEPPFVSPIKG